MQNDDFKNELLAAYCKARTEGFNETAEVLLKLLKLETLGPEETQFTDRTTPPQPLPVRSMN